MTAVQSIKPTALQDLTKEVHRLIKEASDETCSNPCAVWARAFAFPSAALIVRGIKLTDYEQLTRELTEAQQNWQQGLV